MNKQYHRGVLLPLEEGPRDSAAQGKLVKADRPGTRQEAIQDIVKGLTEYLGVLHELRHQHYLYQRREAGNSDEGINYD
ncbi:hypothetical protein ACFLTZ_05565 [Chloroflexota bacterium]